MRNVVSPKSFRAPFSKGAIAPLLKRQFLAIAAHRQLGFLKKIPWRRNKSERS